MPILRVLYIFSMNCMRCLDCKRGMYSSTLAFSRFKGTRKGRHSPRSCRTRGRSVRHASLAGCLLEPTNR
jgi:hypothetical protein